MKRSLMFLFIIFGLFISIMADESKNSSQKTWPLPLKTQPKTSPPDFHRKPMRFPIEAYYCQETSSIEIIAEESVQAEVYLYHNGEIIDYSNEISTIFILPYPHGEYNVFIEGDNWIAEGYINL